MNELEHFLSKAISYPHWKKIGIYPHHGINIPLFAIRSKTSCGIGEYPDLKLLIDYLHELGMDMLQLLPLNDSGVDPSPYNALSSCALHPIYIGLFHLPNLTEREKKALYKIQRHNQTERVAYQEVYQEKMRFLLSYAQKHKDRFQKDPEFLAFQNQQTWLKPYALFKVFKEIKKGTSSLEWPQEMKKMSQTKKKEYEKIYQEDMLSYEILQFLAYKQLSEIKTYAEQRKIFIKGDIPILISPDSVDVWFHPELFDLSLAAGAPPDVFNEEGQYWGFPIYNWRAMAEQNYEWWRKRLELSSHFFHLYRIDHVIGFFRIWAIPRGGNALEGKYLPKKENVMFLQGKRLLEMMLETTEMLPIAEDLGFIPKEVTHLLRDLGIPGTRVFRWERHWESDLSYLPFSQYPPINMSTVSTHDSETLEQWWHERPEEVSRFCQMMGWQKIPPFTKKLRLQLLKSIHHCPTLFHINLLPEYLNLYEELSWKSPEDERINFPGTVQIRNWTYKIRPTLEELAMHRGLKKTFKEVLSIQ